MLTLTRLAVGGLTELTLTVQPTEVVCLSGPSGAGKTRLLRAVADLEPHQGAVAFNGTGQNDVPAHRWRRQVMLVPAESQWWEDRVLDHFPAGEVAGWQALGFREDPSHWEISRLSSGEKQRLSLLRALALAPGALLLDEPTANLDGATRQATETWLQERIAASGMPVLWVAHDADQIARVAHRHLSIRNGTLEPAPCR